MFSLKKLFVNKKIVIALVILAVLVLGYFYFSKTLATKENISNANLTALTSIISATGTTDDNKLNAIKLLNITDAKYTAILNSQEGNKLTKLKELLSINA
jgi:Flp pilus assembly protein TadG